MGCVNNKALLLLALVVVYTIQEVVSKQESSASAMGKQMRKSRETPPELEEEEAAAAEEERRQREIEEEMGRGGRGSSEREEEEEKREKKRRVEDMFLLGEGERVVRTEAGEMRVVRGLGHGGSGSVGRALHIGLIMMEPRSMFVPQYWDSELVLYLSRGEAKIGMIYKDALVEKNLRTGDVYRVQAGSTFYILNTAEGQRLHIISCIDPSEESFRTKDIFRSFYIGGGANPASVLAGFEPQTLSTAFNVSISELKEIMTSQKGGPIVFTDSHGPATTSLWTGFDTLKKDDRLQKLKRLDLSLNTREDINHDEEDDDMEEENNGNNGWSFRTFVNRVLLGGEENDNKWRIWSKKGPDAFNLKEAKPDFKNNYGWTLAVDKHRYHQLKQSKLGVYYVNLTAGSMLAPHVNPTAAEYGVVLRGSGTIQIVYPNGTSAINTRVKEGSVFRVPQYYPFCQIASRSGPFEFFGFSTSGKRNHPQFLVGTTSILRTMAGSEFAASFGVTLDRFKEILDAQRESVILPTPGAAPGGVEKIVNRDVGILEMGMEFE